MTGLNMKKRENADIGITSVVRRPLDGAEHGVVWHLSAPCQYQRRDDVRLLVRSLVEIERPRRVVVVGEALGPDAPLPPPPRFNNRGAVEALVRRPGSEVSDNELGSQATRPAGCIVCMCPSR